LRLLNEIHSALYDEDIVGLEQIIKKVGAEAAFGVFLTEDWILSHATVRGLG
tara:strand:- start:72 stop:227 length:156 start_codon:yes stop_codon:yes gene_type:complete